MLNQLLRYYPVIEILAQNSPQTILEVGSGSTGLGKYIDFSFIGVDDNFTDYSGTPQPLSPFMTPVFGQASHLPFDDNSFDAVICVDTLEHIPPDERDRTLRELLRVTHHTLVVSCPCDSLAREHDEALKDYLVTKKIPVPGWLDEHLEIDVPTREALLRSLAQPHLTVTVTGNVGLRFHSLVMKGEFSRISRILLGVSKLAEAVLRLRRSGTAIVYRHKLLAKILSFFLRLTALGTPYRINIIAEKDLAPSINKL